jgi:tripartite-type tricarboxylate transporter receptor subunit TctC
MTLRRRQFLHLASGVVALPALSQIARAQTYPTRPVRIIVGYAAGGTGDITARLIGQWLSERLGQSFIIENRPGAGGNVGTEAVVNAPSDGYTLLLASIPNAVNATLYGNIAPVAGILRVPYVMVVNPSFPAKTVPEFIAHVKANPTKVNMASGGVGSGNHLSGELFNIMAGVNMTHVPYRGQAPALTDLLGGQVQVLFATTPGTTDYIRTGKLRALAVTTATRAEVLPDLPFVGEFVPGYEASQRYGIGAPKTTASEIVEKLNQEINAAFTDPTMKARFADIGGEVLRSSPTEFGKLIADETKKWAKVIKFAGIKTD